MDPKKPEKKKFQPNKKKLEKVDKVVNPSPEEDKVSVSEEKPDKKPIKKEKIDHTKDEVLLLTKNRTLQSLQKRS